MPAAAGKVMKLAIIGSRSITSVDLAPLITERPSLIISGGARGVDACAEEYARRHGIPSLIIRPDYRQHGRIAPILRDKAIAEACDAMLAVWDGLSRGTQFTIGHARRLGRPVRVILVGADRPAPACVQGTLVTASCLKKEK